MKKFKLFKMLAVLIVLITSINTAWAANRRIYINTASATYWNDGFLYAWNDTGNKRYAITGSESTNLKYYDIDESYTKFLLYRSSKIDDEWGVFWNQSEDVTIGSNNYWNITDGDSDSDGKKDISGDCRYAPTGAIVGLGDDWNVYKHPMSAGSVSITLAANTTYTFKVLKDFTYYNQSSAYVGQTSALRWTSAGDVKCHLTTAGAGSYTFTWDDTNKDLTVTYPNVSTIHPSTDYIYFKKPAGWGGVKAYIYDSEVVGWSNAPTLTTCTFDGNPYYFAALGASNDVIFYDTSNDKNKTSDLNNITGHKGEYYDQTILSPDWADFKVVITLNNQSATTAGTTSVNPVYKTEVLSTITPPEKDDYTFDGYYTAVSGGGVKLINKSGAWLEVSGYTDASKHWIRKSSEMLYANWTQEPGVTLTASKTSGINVGETITLTATPSQAPSISKYEFYLSDDTKIGEVTAPTNTFSYTPSTVGDKTVYVKMYYNSTTLNSDNLELTLNTPSVSLGEGSSTTEMWIGVNASSALTFNATSSNVGSSASVTWSISDASSGTFTQTSAGSYSGKSWTYLPASTGAKTVTVTMAVGGEEYTRTYNLTVYERWNIYVHDVQSWGKMSVYSHTAETHGSWPGTVCSKYNSTNSWYTVTLDSKGTKTILNKNGEKDSGNDVKANEITTGTSTGTYAAGTYWYISAFNNGTLTSVSVTDPEVEITSATVVSGTQLMLVGRVTVCGGDGTTASDMKSVGFNIGSGDVAATCKDGKTFTKVFTGLTPGETYTVKAFAENVHGKSYSSTQDETMRSGETYTIKVRVPLAANAPYIYAFTDNTSNSSCGGTKDENATWPGEGLSSPVSGTVYKWYSYELSNEYDNFIISDNGSNKTDDLDAPGSATCYWYKASEGTQSNRCDDMTCPSFDTQLMIETTAGSGSYSYHDMSGSGPYTKTVSLAAKSTYKFKPTYNGEWLGKASVSLTRASYSATGLSAAVENELEITTDAAGDYTFTFTSPSSISVTYPTAYVVTYSAVTIGSGDGESAAPSAEAEGSIAVTSTDYVLAGKDVTFTAEDENEGYTFQGWFDTSSPTIGTTEPLTTEQEYTAEDIAGAVTVYAIYTENKHSVSVETDGTTGSSVSPSSVSNIGIATKSGDISATIPNAAWHFKNWTLPTGVTAATGKSATSNPIQINATEDSKTIIANFEPRYGLIGSLADDSDNANMPGWTDGSSADFEVIDFNGLGDDGVDLECTRTLLPNRQYKFMVVDRKRGQRCGLTSAADIHENNWKLDASGTRYHVLFWTAGYGDYTFHITNMGTETENYPSIQIDRPSCHKIVTLGRKVYYNEDTDSEDATDSNGGTVSAQTNEGTGDGYPITSGQYFLDESDVVFTAVPATGYRVEGWYNNADCADEHKYEEGSNVAIGENTLTLSDLKENVTVYVKFEEIMQEVELGRAGNDYEGTIKVGDDVVSWGTKVKVGVHTSVTITAVPNTHYYFAHWYRFEGQNYVLSGETEDYATVTITGSVEKPAWYGVYSDLLSPSFLQLEQIYFYNWDETANADAGGPLWDSVYVGFNPNWNETSSPAGKWYGADMYGKSDSAFAMTRGSETPGSQYYRYWVADVPRWVTRYSKKKIVFFNKGEMRGWNHFDHYKASYRTDYNKLNNMFVPEHTVSGIYNTDCNYYNNGYWKNYYNSAGRGQGYYLQKYSGSAWTELGEFTASESGYAPELQYEVRIDNMDKANNKFRIISAGGIYYNVAADVTGSAYSNLSLNNGGSAGFMVDPSVEGEYIFYIDQSKEKMKLNVNYPVAIGDYRLKHSYNVKRPSTGAIDSTVYAYSDVIKARLTLDTVSMYLNMDAATKTLVLQKCTGTTTIAGKVKPVWSSGTAVSDFNTTTFAKNKGVYKFAITVDNTDKTTSQDVVSATPSAAELYNGPYYIKTDTAKGRWVNYKQNVLYKNTITFDKADSTTYDYYFVAWIPWSDGNKAGRTPTNIKCVIANDYNNAVSDTLIGDAIIGMAKQTLPDSSNVRFSYNSATNEVKRTYFKGAVAETFLYLVPNAAGFVYDMTPATPVDLYDSNPEDESYIAQAKFEDDQNWTYELHAQAYPTSQAGVQAKYNGKTQVLLPKTNSLIGGAKKGTNMYPMRLVYDFKTNYLMSAYTPVGAITDTLKNIDVLIEREGQGAGTAITFGPSSGKLEAKKMIGAIKFTKSNYMDGSSSLVSDWNAEGVRGKLKFLISFPFDVRMQDIFGLNATYGRAYKIQRYDGAGRAENGFFIGDGINSFWKDMTLADTIKANVGYAVICDNDYFGGTFGDIWKNGPTAVYLYFPSMEAIGDVSDQSSVTVSVPAHTCNSNREFTYFPASGPSIRVSHKYTDSHWNMMGVPTFTDYTGNKTTGTGDYDPGTLFVDTEINPEDPIAYFYAWSDTNNKFTITAADGYAFKSMHGYMVQYTGDVTFKGTAITPAAVAARRVVEKKNYQIELQALNNDEEMINHTYVELRENACDTFALNEDVFMSSNSKAIEVFTFAGNYNVAANVLSVGNHTVPVGVIVNAAGTYTFSMPSNFDGTVTLIDTYTQTRTNLALGDYEISLPQGTTLDRFLLEININQAPTAIDGVEGGTLKDGKAHKFIENGVMYILENGNLYDARGNRVK